MFKVCLFEHGVILAESKARSLVGAIRWADGILTDKTERAFIGAFGQVFAVFNGREWTKLKIRGGIK